MKRILPIVLWSIWLSLMTAGAAHADPITGAITAFVAWAGTAAGSFVMGIVATVAQTLIGQLMKKPIKDKGTKERMDNGADKPPKIIIGRYGTPGHLLYHNSYGSNSSLYVQVIILSVLPVGGLSNYVRIGGRSCSIDYPTVDADGFSPVLEYNKHGKQYCKIKFYPGGQTTADPWLVEKFGTDHDFAWTADMICKGCAYVVVQNLYSKKGVWSAQPDFFFTVDGIPLYDPRRDTSVGGSGIQRWNDRSTWGGPGDLNPKVQIYNIIRGIPDLDGSLLWGGRAEAYRLPLDYWFAAMNACGTPLEKKDGATIPTYAAGAEIELDDQPIEVILELDKACSGYTTEYGGTYKTWCGVPGLSVMTITDDDFFITEKATDDLFKPVQDTYNSAVATYPEPRAGWTMEPAPLYVDDDYLADDDNEPLVLDIQLPYVTEINQVQRLVRAAVKDSRGGPTHQGVLPPEAAILEPHDRISYISKRNGYNGGGVDFLIASKDDNPDVSQMVLLRAVNPNAFGWVKEMELDHTVGKLGVIAPGTLDIPFTLSPDWIDNGNGRDKPAIAITWDWGDIDVDIDRVLWRLRLHGSTAILAHGTLGDLADGNYTLVSTALRFKHRYDVSFYAKPISDRDTDWTGWQSVLLYDIDIPGAPTLTRVSDLGDDGTLDFYLDIDWTAIAGEGEYQPADGSQWRWQG